MRRIGVPALLLAGALLLAAHAGGEDPPRTGRGQGPAPIALPPLVPATFAAAARAVSPAVISISLSAGDGGIEAPPYGEFPEGELAERALPDLPGLPVGRSIGSGLIVDAAGIAITSAHLVQGAKHVEVTMADGEPQRAAVVALDEKTDLAVIRLDPGRRPFPAAPLGDSDAMRVGDWVVAIGSPYGLQATVTAGIISARARHVAPVEFDDFFQTSAMTTVGSTGGPLVNLRGQVIGINTTLMDDGSGITFAIPSNIARKVYTELLARGRVIRGWLGLAVQPLTRELARALGAEAARGMLIADVTPGGPAARAGLHPGDVLLRFGGQGVDSQGALRRALWGAAPGQAVRLGVWSAGRERVVAVTVGEEPDEREPPAEARRALALLGFEARAIAPDLGVVVSRVEPLGPAEEAGVRRGDVIRQIGPASVRTMADLARLTRSVRPGDRVAILLQRGRIARYVALRAVPERQGP